jgi:hypothetical protein
MSPTTETNGLKESMLYNVYSLVSELINDPPMTDKGEINAPMLRVYLDCAIIAYNAWKEIVTTAAADKAYYAFKNLNSEQRNRYKAVEHKIALLKVMYMSDEKAKVANPERAKLD